VDLTNISEEQEKLVQSIIALSDDKTEQETSDSSVPTLSEEELAEIKELNENYIEEETMLDSNEGIEIAPGQGQIPLPILLDKYCDELAFPTIWAGNGRFGNHDIKFPFEKCVNSELRRSDRRAARPDYLLYLLKKTEIKQLMSSINMVLRKNDMTSNITASQATQNELMNDMVTKDNAYRFTSSITGSPAYWEKQKKNVLAIVRQYGIFTFFITLSAAETHWTELLMILKKVVDHKEISEQEAKDMEFMEKARLIRTDPITCALYFDHRFKELVKTWNSDDGPFKSYRIVRHYYRIEFQHRGSPHVHMILWLDDAPQYRTDNPDSNKNIVDFIDSIITTNGSDLQIVELIKYQFHKCTKTCQRKVNRKEQCRFGAPFLPFDETRILEPFDYDANIPAEKKKEAKNLLLSIKEVLDGDGKEWESTDQLLDHFNITLEEYIFAVRLSLKQRKVFLKRSPRDRRINPYSKKILLLMRSNMDLQYVLDPYACIGYIVDYINKSARGLSRLMRQCVEDCKKGNLVIRQQLKSIANVLYNSSEVSAQEAAYRRLHLPMSSSSVVVEFINTSPYKVRNNFA
jgi:Helitron helicase-like domain at N-terminus